MTRKKSLSQKLKSYIVRWLVSHGKRDVAVRYFPKSLKDYEFEKIERVMAALVDDWDNKFSKGDINEES